jgi:hypothetical protein
MIDRFDEAEEVASVDAVISIDSIDRISPKVIEVRMSLWRRELTPKLPA